VTCPRRALRAGLLCLLALSSVRLPAQSLVTTIYPENAQPWKYVAPPISSHCLQTYRLYLPQAPNVMPENGWPVLIQIQLSGYQRSPDIDSMPSDSFLASFLEAGIAVVVARATPSILMNDPYWEEWCGNKKPNIPGHGMFHPPDVVPPDLAASGIAPYNTFEYAMPEKDAVMLIQHVRFMARQTSQLVTEQQQKMALLDHRRIGVHGVSAGGTVLMWATLGPDRRDHLPFAGLSGQYAESSHPDVAAFSGCPVWWPVFHPNLRPVVNHFGFQGHSEVPAPSMGTASLDELVAASALAYQDPEQAASLPTYITYWEKSVAEHYDMLSQGCGNLPFCFQDQGLEGLETPTVDFEHHHPAWSGYVWKTEHPDARLVITDAEAWAQAHNVPAVPIFGQPTSSHDADVDLRDWFIEQFAAIEAASKDPHDNWHDAGYGLAGSHGVPTLVGEGSLLPGSPCSFTLRDCRRDAPLVLFGGYSSVYLPLAGGMLVPYPDRVLVFYKSDPLGGLFVPTGWPVNGPPSGSHWYVQAFVLDPAGPRGFAISNALELTVP